MWVLIIPVYHSMDVLFSLFEMLMIWLQEILEAREKEKFHIWSFRTPEEAASNWEELFGHLDEVE